MNRHGFRTVLEPDGRRGHWLKVDKQLRQVLAVSEGDTVVVEVEPTKDWPEPDIPEDFQTALAAAPDISEVVEGHHIDGALGMGALDTVQRRTPKLGNDASRSESRNCDLVSDGPAVSISQPAPTRTCRRTADSSTSCNERGLHDGGLSRETGYHRSNLLPEGVYHWTATHPEWEGPVSAYAIDDGARLILIDPIAVPDDVRELFGSREVVTVLTSTWHERDAASLGFPVWAPAPDRPEDQLVPATRYAIGDSLFGMEAYPGREGQLDLVLWSERIRAVIAGDTLINLGEGLEIAASWLPEGVTVEQVATALRPLLDKPVEIVLPTHGEPTDRAALEHALT